jgi:nucleoside-diphosphate-sugar epimerase
MYGEGQAPGSLYSQLKQAVTRGERQFNLSGGEQLRDYLPVEQIASYLVALALDRRNAGAVNICSGQPISIRTLVEGWLKENNWQIELNFGHYPYPDYEPMAFWGDRRRLDTILRGS